MPPQSTAVRELKRITPIQAVGIPMIVCLVVVLASSVFGGSSAVRQGPSGVLDAQVLGQNPAVAGATPSNPGSASAATAQAPQPAASSQAAAASAPSVRPGSSVTVAPTAAQAPATSSQQLPAATAARVLPRNLKAQPSSAQPGPSSPIPLPSGAGFVLPSQSSATAPTPQVSDTAAAAAPTAPSTSASAAPRTRAAAPFDTSTNGATAPPTFPVLTTGESIGLLPGVTSAQAATALATGQPVPGASSAGSTAANPLPGTNVTTYKPPAGDPTSSAYWGLGVYPSSQPPPANWTPLVSNAYQVLPLSAAPYGYGPGNPFYGIGSAPWIDGNANDGTRDPITGQVWYPVTQAGGPSSPGWKYPAFGG